MTPEIVQSISDRYIELYEQITGEKFVKPENEDIIYRVELAINNTLSRM